MKRGHKKKQVDTNPVGLVEWELAAREELKGENPWLKLTHTVHGLAIKPIYSKNKGSQPASLLPANLKSFLGPRTWYNCPRIRVADEKKSNETALDYLNHGADGLLFDLHDDVDLKKLLKNVDDSACSINFLIKKNSTAFAENLQQHLAKNKKSKNRIPGALFANQSISGHERLNYYLSGFEIDGSTPAEEVSRCLSILKETNKAALSISLDEDFFFTISKLRAIRLLWNKITSPDKLFIHGYSPAWTNAAYQPHANLLKSTTTALAGILGGCDAITIEPETNDNSMVNRIARNVSNILREESWISKTADPLAGAWFVETMTQQLAEQAMDMMKGKMK